MNHDAYRPKDSVEIRRQAVAGLQKEIELKFDEALFGNLIEDDMKGAAFVLVRTISDDIYKLLIKGSDKDSEKEFSIENFSLVGQVNDTLTAGRAVLQPVDNPGVLIEDHRSEHPRLTTDTETIQFYSEIINTSRLLTAQEKEEHRTEFKRQIASILGLEDPNTN